MTETPMTEVLEALIDKHSLLDVLVGLELVCAEKAEHIRANWQDGQLAKAWDKAATVCGNAARHKSVGALP